MINNMNQKSIDRMMLLSVLSDEDKWEYDKFGETLIVWNPDFKDDLVCTTFWVQPEESWEGNGRKICFHEEYWPGHTEMGVGVCMRF